MAIPQWLIAIGLVLSSGCIFSTRAPESPQNDNTGPPWVSPTDPAIVLDNLRKTFNAKYIDNYNRSLTDDFTFVPDPIDFSQTGGACFSNWNKDKEISVFTDILNTAGNLSYTWGSAGEAQSVPETPDDRYYRLLPYTMRFTGAVDTIFVGKVDLYMRQVNGNWLIYRWEDTRASADTLSLGRVRCEGAIRPKGF